MIVLLSGIVVVFGLILIVGICLVVKQLDELSLTALIQENKR